MSKKLLLNNKKSNLIFKINKDCLDTTKNTLTDAISNIPATLTGTPTKSDTGIIFTTKDTFIFNISSLALIGKDFTLRTKFKPTVLNTDIKNVLLFGESNAWTNSITCYVGSNSGTRLQFGTKSITNVTVGQAAGNSTVNRYMPTLNEEMELVISFSTNKDIRYFINGILVQNGISLTMLNPLVLSNTEGQFRFEGEYNIIEIYEFYLNEYKNLG